MALAILTMGTTAFAGDPIVHDAEFYVLKAQNGERWAEQDKALDARLQALREKHGRPPNIIHIMWDDTAFGDVGIPAIQKVRGLTTPNLNRIAAEGILFTRMYTEVGCTPSRAACATGRLAIRSGMYNIGMLGDSHGIRASEVTITEVLGEVGYATAFHGKWHLGDIEQSYPHNQGFDEAFFTGYNQVLSLNNRIAEGAKASIGLFEDMLPKDPYKLDDTFITKGWVQIAEGTKGGPTRQWGDNTHETYLKIDPEAQRRTIEFIERNARGGGSRSTWATGRTSRPSCRTRRSSPSRGAFSRTGWRRTSTRSSAGFSRSCRNWASPRAPSSSPWPTTARCPTTRRPAWEWPRPSSGAARVTSPRAA